MALNDNLLAIPDGKSSQLNDSQVFSVEDNEGYVDFMADKSKNKETEPKKDSPKKEVEPTGAFAMKIARQKSEAAKKTAEKPPAQAEETYYDEEDESDWLLKIN